MDASVGCTSSRKAHLYGSMFKFLGVQGGVVWQPRICTVPSSAMACVSLSPTGWLGHAVFGNLGKPNMDGGCRGGIRLAIGEFVCRG